MEERRVMEVNEIKITVKLKKIPSNKEGT